MSPDSSAQQPHSLEVFAPRPMAEAVLALGEQMKCVITYEDPLLMHAQDMRAVVPGSAAWVPKFGWINYEFSWPSDRLNVIRGLLVEYAKQGNPGEFEVLQVGDTFDVVPVKTRKETGEVIDYVSLIETKISLTLLNSTLFDVLEALCAEISKENSNFDLLLGRVPMNIVSAIPFSIDITDESPRVVLSEMLDLVNARLSTKQRNPFYFTWQLRQDASPSPPKDGVREAILAFRRIELNREASNKIRIMDARPMALAVRTLAKRFDVATGYEDPQFLCPCDLLGSDYPRGGFVNLDWDNGESVEKIFSRLADLKPGPSSNYFVANFVSEVIDGRYVVYPTTVKDESGIQVAMNPLSKRRVSVGQRDINAHGVMLSLTEQLELATGKPVRFREHNPSISSKLNTVRTSRNVQDQRLDVLLDGILDETDPNLCWEILYEPALEGHSIGFFDRRN